MQTFFFISGYFAYKKPESITGSGWGLVKNKILELVVPTVIWYILFQLCNRSNPHDFFQKGPQGYWFTLSLFVNFLFYYIFTIVQSKLCLGRGKIAFIVFITAWLVGIYLGSIIDTGPSIIRVATLPGSFGNMTWFFAGILFRMYDEEATSFVTNRYVFAVILTTLLLGIMVLSMFDVKNISPYLYYSLHSFLVPLLAVLVLFVVFYKSSDYFDYDGKVSLVLQFMGRRSLDIYLMHYFLLPKLSDYQSIFYSGGREFLVGEIFVVGILALAIIAVCMVISNCIRKSDILARYMFGVKKDIIF